MAELEYISQYEGTEIDAAVGFGKTPNTDPTEGSHVGVESGGIFTAIKTAKETLEQKLYHRNLLNNPMFRIDQRQGYIIPSGTAYYSDSGLTTQVGTTSADCNGTVGNGTYGMVKVSNTWYYCAWSSSFVRGYVGNGYSTDCFYSENGYFTIDNDGCLVIPWANYKRLIQFATQKWVNENIIGKPITASIMYKSGRIASGTITVPERTSSVQNINVFTDTTEGVSYNLYLRANNEPAAVDQIMRIYATNGASPLVASSTIKAVMLEEGSVSTMQAWYDLGAYDEDLDLWKCRYYFQRINAVGNHKYAPFGTASWWDNSVGTAYLDMLRDMRVVPQMTINGNLGVEGGGTFVDTNGGVTFGNPSQMTENKLMFGFTYSGSISNMNAQAAILRAKKQYTYIDLSAEL